jgi:hypothetical protein
MTYDAANAEVVMVRPGTETWAWNGSSWTMRHSGTLPASATGAAFAFSPVTGKCYLFGGLNGSNGTNETWEWDGATGTWTRVLGPRTPATRFGCVGAYDLERQEFVVSHGRATTTGTTWRTDTWALRDRIWYAKAGSVYTFDLNSRADSIWNFSSITVPAGVTVFFQKNAANTAALWLASENVQIDGTLFLGGGNGLVASPSTGIPYSFGGAGGAGGFDGGQGTGGGAGPTAGGGPGGGVAGNPGINALHADATGSGPYGTLFAQPAIGGSGGGGGGVAGGATGGGGGGGGGAIVIACSKDITVNGQILAQNGLGTGSPKGGDGSGGLIRLIADRVVMGSAALVDPGDSLTTGKGRARIEAYVRSIPDEATQVKGSKSLSVPVLGSVLNQAGGRLWFAKVSGQNVANPPRGDAINPDVVFTATGEVEFEVHALNVPDGTPVTVTINHSLAGTINLPASGQVTLQQCKAIFTATIPAGTGVMQAFATYNVGGPTGNGQP